MSVNVKVKKIIIIVEQSLIIFCIAGINAALCLSALAYNLILSASGLLDVKVSENGQKKN